MKNVITKDVNMGVAGQLHSPNGDSDNSNGSQRAVAVTRNEVEQQQQQQPHRQRQQRQATATVPVLACTNQSSTTTTTTAFTVASSMLLLQPQVSRPYYVKPLRIIPNRATELRGEFVRDRREYRAYDKTLSFDYINSQLIRTFT